jgi:hypothetical protein
MVFDTLDSAPLVAEIRGVLDLQSNAAHIHVCLPAVGSAPDRRPDRQAQPIGLARIKIQSAMSRAVYNVKRADHVAF